MAKKVVLAGACRTAIGKMGGGLSKTPAPVLGSIVIEEALKRAGVPKEEVDHVYMGCVIQAGLGQNVARQASIKAGLPIETPAVTVNVVCGSGLNCVNMAAQMIEAGDADIVVAGGMENMSMAPYAMMQGRFGYRMNNGKLVDTMVNDALWDAFNQYHMMITAENVADQWNLTREELDEFAASSQQKCEAAIAAGGFDAEIVPVQTGVDRKTKEPIIFSKDEGPRAALGGVDPSIMGVGPVASTNKLLKKTGLTIDDMDIIEANEAFAAQSVAVAKDLKFDMSKVNKKGGAIALGHPVGASGCRILVTLLHQMEKGQKGLATLCIGGGMGCSTIVEKE